MITSEEILKRLQKGEKLEDIGNELATILNAANAQHQKDQKKEKRKVELMNILGDLMVWYDEYYGLDTEYDVEELAEAAISTIEELSSLSKLLNTNLLDLNKNLEKKTPKPQKNTLFENDLNDIVRMFIGD